MEVYKHDIIKDQRNQSVNIQITLILQNLKNNNK